MNEKQWSNKLHSDLPRNDFIQSIKVNIQSNEIKTYFYPSSQVLFVFLSSPGGIGLARVGFLVPSAVRIADTAQAVVVAAVAHDDVDLAQPMVRRHVDRLVLHEFKARRGRK